MKLTAVSGFFLSLLVSTQLAQIPFVPLETNIETRNVWAIHRDSLGYLWFGNDLGQVRVVRYDGNQFQEYRHDPNRTDSVTNGVTNDIHEDSNEILWIATEEGLNRYIPTYDSFVRYEHDPKNPRSLGKGKVLQISETPTKDLWILTEYTLNRYNRESDTFDVFTPIDRTRNVNPFCSFAVTEDGEFWLVGIDELIWKFSPQTGAFSASNLLLPFLRQDRGYRKIYCDSENRLWITDETDPNPGLFRFDHRNMRIRAFDLGNVMPRDRYNSVRNVIEYPEGQLVLCVYGGLVLFDIETEAITKQPYDENLLMGIGSDRPSTLHKDQEGFLWLGSSLTGIDYYNPLLGKFITYKRGSFFPKQQLPEFEVTNILETNDGDILASTRYGGLSVINPESRAATNLHFDLENPRSIPRREIRSMAQDEQGHVWLGTWGEGLRVLKKVDGIYVQVEEPIRNLPEKLRRTFIWDVHIDHKDRFWLSIKHDDDREIALLDPELNLIQSFRLSNITPGWHAIFQNGDKNEVLVTMPDGVCRYNESTGKLDQFIDGRPPITTVCFEPESERYYVGTSKSGLFAYDRTGRLIDSFDSQLENFGHRVHSIEALSASELWLGTRNGLCYLNPQTNTVFTFYEADGLQGNSYAQNLSLRTREGDLYFAGYSGVSAFDPSTIEKQTNQPYTTIDGISLAGVPIDHRDPEAPFSVHPQALNELILNWKQNRLSFSFTGVNVTAPDDIRYAYKLEGVDDKWIYTDRQQRSASYANISPGVYTFRVKSSTVVGMWGEQEAQIEIRILTPFWKQAWFYVVVGLMAALLFFAFITHREKKLKRDRTRLTAMVDEKTRELTEHQEQLETTVENRTKELRLARDEAETALARAEESDRLKSQFLANLSHEIRTPLNAIAGFSSLICESDLDNETRRQFSALISENTDSLLTLIDDIMDLSMIAEDQLKIEYAPYSVNELVENIYSAFAIREADNTILVKMANPLHREHLYLEGDRSRIKQIIDNLMNNALKFTKEGHVRLGVSRDEETISFYVEDTGPGIPADERDLIFEKFVKRQVDDLAANRGVGLGLAICTKLAQLMGGELTVESEVGKGSSFILRLPIIAADAPEDENDADLYRQIHDRKTVLVIEDEASNYEYMKAALAAMDIESSWAVSGEEGLSILEQENAFDLVLLDIKMPGIDGYETLKRIRSIDSQMKVIAQTAYAMENDESKIRKAGFDDYLSKPIRPERLAEVLERNF